MFKEKRGISAIVATLIIILLAIVAFAIVATVVQNQVENSAQEFNLQEKCLDVGIEATKVKNVSGSGNYSVTLDRDAGGEAIDGVRLVFEDQARENSRSENIDEEIAPVSKFTAQIDIDKSFKPATIQVIPYFNKENGEKYLCQNIGDTREITIEQT